MFLFLFLFLFSLCGGQSLFVEAKDVNHSIHMDKPIPVPDSSSIIQEKSAPKYKGKKSLKKKGAGKKNKNKNKKSKKSSNAKKARVASTSICPKGIEKVPVANILKGLDFGNYQDFLHVKKDPAFGVPVEIFTHFRAKTGTWYDVYALPVDENTQPLLNTDKIEEGKFQRISAIQDRCVVYTEISGNSGSSDENNTDGESGKILLLFSKSSAPLNKSALRATDVMDKIRTLNAKKGDDVSKSSDEKDSINDNSENEEDADSKNDDEDNNDGENDLSKNQSSEEAKFTSGDKNQNAQNQDNQDLDDLGGDSIDTSDNSDSTNTSDDQNAVQENDDSGDDLDDENNGDQDNQDEG